MPDPIPLRPRRDGTAAEPWPLEPPPVPFWLSRRPFLEPDWPPEDEPA